MTSLAKVVRINYAHIFLFLPSFRDVARAAILMHHGMLKGTHNHIFLDSSLHGLSCNAFSVKFLRVSNIFV